MKVKRLLIAPLMLALLLAAAGPAAAKKDSPILQKVHPAKYTELRIIPTVR